jgi:phosphatidylinositol alpha-1,6-mannosyltransferase
MYLIVTRSFPPEIGGMQKLMWGLAKSISKYDLTKVITDFQENHEEFDDNVSFTIERVKGFKLLKKYRKSNLINSFLKTNKAKCIIADHWKSLELIKTDDKKICLIHSKEINHKKGSGLNNRVLNVLNNVDYVVSNSNFTKNLATEIGVNPEKILVINPGIEPIKDIDKKSQTEAEKLLRNKKPKIITVARFDKRKNHEKVIMAIKNLKQIYPNIIYICVGYGEEEENIKKLISELNLNENVLLIKNASQNLTNALISKSNIFVMPSIIHKKSVEGFGISFIEAAELGIPSIGGKDGGASDAIIHDKTGLIVDGNDLDEIYSSINKLLERNKFIEFGKNAKENSKNFYWDKIVKKYLKII